MITVGPACEKALISRGRTTALANTALILSSTTSSASRGFLTIGRKPSRGSFATRSKTTSRAGSQNHTWANYGSPARCASEERNHVQAPIELTPSSGEIAIPVD